MGHVYSDVLLHVVFATKGREPFLSREFAPKMQAYLAGIVKETGGAAYIIGGYREHVHLLLSPPLDVTVPDLMHQVKGASSRWTKEYVRLYRISIRCITTLPSRKIITSGFRLARSGGRCLSGMGSTMGADNHSPGIYPGFIPGIGSGRESQFRRLHHHHLVDLHVLDGVRDAADAKARLPQTGEGHIVHSKRRVVVHHYRRGVQPGECT